jgi:hypothetical protein
MEQPPPASGLSVSWSAAIIILVLTLLVWMLFWELQEPLDPGATAVVALVVAVLVVASRSLLSRVRRASAPQARKPP